MSYNIKNYKDLQIWNMGIDIVEKTYVITKTFPASEIYCLGNQMRRSAISIPSNIAEGFLRYSRKELLRFLYIALGSCGELETQILISRRLLYMTTADSDKFCSEIAHISKMIRNLIKSLIAITNHKSQITKHGHDPT